MRMLLQSVVLAVGAYLVIQQEASAGIIVASSILTGRALAPMLIYLLMAVMLFFRPSGLFPVRR